MNREGLAAGVYGISGADLGHLRSYFVEVCVLKACGERKGQDRSQKCPDSMANWSLLKSFTVACASRVQFFIACI